jgi:hypothetical protein
MVRSYDPKAWTVPILIGIRILHFFYENPLLQKRPQEKFISFDGIEEIKVFPLTKATKPLLLSLLNVHSGPLTRAKRINKGFPSNRLQMAGLIGRKGESLNFKRPTGNPAPLPYTN